MNSDTEGATATESEREGENDADQVQLCFGSFAMGTTSKSGFYRKLTSTFVGQSDNPMSDNTRSIRDLLLPTCF
jgi:hypothetical protein